MAYIPYPAYYDDAPIDLRHVYADERPAGKHGFLKCAGDHFEFEDGTPGRFWGTNFNGGANFPEHDYADKVALRLAKIGVNIVRFHQLDAEWDTPNIFKFTKGPRCAATQEFDAESMDRLDYLIYALKKQGIYCYMDMFTYRRFKTDEGVVNAHTLGDAGKPYDCFDKRMIELQKKLAYDIWNHFNPYTQLKYKDDPVFVMAEIVNESNFISFKAVHEPYASEFRRLFRIWLDENGIEFDAENGDINEPYDKTLQDFRCYLYTKHYEDMMAYLKSIGVKIPICGTNHTITDHLLKANLVCDFTDSHTYYYDWKWGEHRCMNQAITQSPRSGVERLSQWRVFDKPFFVSEWDMPWPNEYRAECNLLWAAIGSMQNWGGFTIHTYAYSNRLDRMNILGKETSGATIGGVAYREGIFSTWNDPAKFGLFYHAALITRRQDVSCEGEKVAIKGSGAAFTAASEKCRVANKLSENCESGTFNDREIMPTDQLVDLESGEVRSDNGQLYRNWKDNYGYIDSPRTKCTYGFLGKNGRQQLDGLAVECETDFAVIALSSLNDKPLDKTDSILLSAIGRAQNTDAKFEGEQMLEYGHAPILAEVIEAKIELKTSRKNMAVWAVNAEGFYIGRIPVTYEDGVLSFEIGKQHLSVYYLIQAE